MRLRGVWTTNLVGLLLGVGMYSAFVLIPQFVETSTSSGYGFGSSDWSAVPCIAPILTSKAVCHESSFQIFAHYLIDPYSSVHRRGDSSKLATAPQRSALRLV